jgi:hypothetical protein
MLSFGDRKSVISLIRVGETSHEVDKTTVEIAFFPKRWTVMWSSAIEIRHNAIDRTDIFRTNKAHGEDGRGDACATLVFNWAAGSGLGHPHACIHKSQPPQLFSEVHVLQ